MSQETIEQKYLDSAMSYSEYVELLDKLFAEGKTTGDDQSEKMINYAGLNQQRMKRISKTFNPSPEFIEAASKLDRKINWIVLTEGWCGDAAQILPLLGKLENHFPNVEMKLLLRDENLDLMDRFLTNGGRSIPMLIAADAINNQVLGNWGPRPTEPTHLLAAYKADPEMTKEDFSKQIQLWYAKDKGRSTENEILELMQKWQ